jgi:hypothetical protein
MSTAGKTGNDSRRLPRLDEYPAYLRKIGRASHWEGPLGSGDVADASQVLIESTGTTSLWHVNDDDDLRRVTIALNEGRSSFNERLDLLWIKPDELVTAGVIAQQTPGHTDCHHARDCHYDAQIDAHLAQALCGILLKAGRGLAKCSKADMKGACSVGLEEGCFPLDRDSRSCGCGATR